MIGNSDGIGLAATDFGLWSRADAPPLPGRMDWSGGVAAAESGHSEELRLPLGQHPDFSRLSVELFILLGNSL